MHGLADEIAEAKSFIRERCTLEPRVAIILGTGLGGLVDAIETEAVIPYPEVPHCPESTSPSHAGQFRLGTLNGVPVITMEGRFHYYEGYSLREVTFPVRVMHALGASTMIVTNAAGGMNPQFSLGDLMLIEDHIDLLPDNPLRGVNDDSLGPRFPDMIEPYSKRLIDLAEATALNLGIRTQKGVFVAVAGPNLETRAEYRMLRNMGADVVGMSTVPEAIVAVHAGMRTLGVSVVTDLCLPDALEPVDIDKIIAVANEGGERLRRLIEAMFEADDEFVAGL